MEAEIVLTRNISRELAFWSLQDTTVTWPGDSDEGEDQTYFVQNALRYYSFTLPANLKAGMKIINYGIFAAYAKFDGEWIPDWTSYALRPEDGFPDDWSVVNAFVGATCYTVSTPEQEAEMAIRPNSGLLANTGVIEIQQIGVQPTRLYNDVRPAIKTGLISALKRMAMDTGYCVLYPYTNLAEMLSEHGFVEESNYGWWVWKPTS